MKVILILFNVLLYTSICFSQLKVGDNVDNINPASVLELESTDQGILLPRLTTPQRNAQNSWAEGHVIYNTTDSCFQFFDGNIWDCMVGQSELSGISPPSGITFSSSSCPLPSPSGNELKIDLPVWQDDGGSVDLIDDLVFPGLDDPNIGFVGFNPETACPSPTCNTTAQGQSYRINLPAASTYPNRSIILYMDPTMNMPRISGGNPDYRISVLIEFAAGNKYTITTSAGQINTAFTTISLRRSIALTFRFPSSNQKVAIADTVRLYSDGASWFVCSIDASPVAMIKL